ncbi:MAG: VCBS repeat-containing protein [Clostridia bacterium]|nr:VCBS repeat-containing protein [Clostridia bacterium]
MLFNSFDRPSLRMQTSSNNFVVLDYKFGDVTGDGIPDHIYLTGYKRYGNDSSFADQITLQIQDGHTYQVVSLPLEVNGGYHPSLFPGDFNGDGVLDTLISIDSGGSGGIGFFYIFSYRNKRAILLFDFEKFNNRYRYDVTYMDHYKVHVQSKTLNKGYILDISTREPEYLSALYNTAGKLIKPVKGDVLPLGGIFPIDINRDSIYELLAVQRIIGIANADTLGTVETTLKWDQSSFKTIHQVVTIQGTPL